jgi:hypothetical protein
MGDEVIMVSIMAPILAGTCSTTQLGLPMGSQYSSNIDPIGFVIIPTMLMPWSSCLSLRERYTLLGLNNSNFAPADEVNAALGGVRLILMVRDVISLQANVALIPNFGADY